MPAALVLPPLPPPPGEDAQAPMRVVRAGTHTHTQGRAPCAPLVCVFYLFVFVMSQ